MDVFIKNGKAVFPKYKVKYGSFEDKAETKDNIEQAKYSLVETVNERREEDEEEYISRL
ncbi:hypothetical protein [Salsuginibacillus kocurii]|uniref:hypothetical protein n=1 Tax=Salsuginibacillus kocurii TaxID=427078 RepID=UPI000361EC67|nr:hypothetical protein [Salsuginibacillus kocurii]